MESLIDLEVRAAKDVDDVAFEIPRPDQCGRAFKDDCIRCRAGAVVMSLRARRNSREPTCRNICVRAGLACLMLALIWNLECSIAIASFQMLHRK